MRVSYYDGLCKIARRGGSRSEATTAVFLIIDRVGRVDVVVGVRSHTGEVQSVYLTDADIEKLVEFLSRKGD
jgi:hypothetical protein